ncbi:MAG TPA: STAS domain-containing protein [Candidatus Limnocylindrales bacterium]|nr:STAS domain-containing protein [Candidatus Limnocylindrales bacterium]
MPVEVQEKTLAPGTVVIALSGKLMMGSQGEQIVAAVERQLAAGARTVIFDLAGITVLDSTGVGCFIASFHKIAAKGATMRMSGATAHVFDTFHVSLLDQVFPFFETAEQAAGAP